jgi:hypothetical protein
MNIRFGVFAAVLMGFCACGLTEPVHAADEDGWVKLFDGETLKGWKKYDGKPISKGWVAEEGVLSLKEKGGGDIITEEQYENFELEFDWKIQPGGNSGVMYLVRTGDPAPYFSGPEYQVLDDAKHADGKNPKTAAGSLYALMAAEGKKVNPPGEWNTGKIVLRNKHLEHWVNGKKLIEIEVRGERWNELVKASKFNAWSQFGQADKGHICLQDHGDPVSYRNIRIRQLEP